MTSTALKTRETRLRRAARRQGLALQKSRMRDPRGIDYGTYQLVDETGRIVAKASGRAAYGLTLDQIEQRLTGR